MELRCCCNPNRVIGELPDPSEEDQIRATHFRPVAVELRTKDGGTCEVTCAALRKGFFGDVFPAYKSDDKPIEFFRNIVGFVEKI